MMRRKGFTLVELVVVILILGILAGVAAPKMLQTSAKATDNGIKQTLAIVRDAIEMYEAQTSSKLAPATSDLFKAALKPYMRGAFPKSPIATVPATADVVSFTTGLTTVPSGTNGWMYNTDTGEFIINSAAASASGVGAYNTF